MRASNSFIELCLQQKRIKITTEMEMDYRRANANFWYTFDQLNRRQRLTSVLPNGYDVKEYKIPKYFQGMMFPSEVTILPGMKYQDYLDRNYSLYGSDEKLSDYQPTLLTPNQFMDEIIFIVGLMKVTLQNDVFIEFDSEPKTMATGNVYQYDNRTDVVDIGTVFPVPVTVNVAMPRNCSIAIDDEYVKDWLIFNFTSKVLTR